MNHSRKVGLFGGSFNPPTIAHLALAQHAHTRLRLSEVWWLVAPHNPNKPLHTLAPFADRMAMCRIMAHDHPWLIVSDWEQRLKTQQTADTLQRLMRHHPAHDFAWLMGTDNLIHFHAWDNWQDIADAVPIAVFARPGEVDAALASPAAHAMGLPQPPHRALTLKPGEWTLCDNGHMAVSATNVRAAIQKGETTDHILPDVAAYISQHGLYRT